MPFSNSELQSLKSILSEQIRELEEDKTFYKESIGNLVRLKKPFVNSGVKEVVDKYNGMIRDQYRDVDKADKKLKRLRGLQESVKAELADQVDAERIEKAAVSLTASLHGLIQKKISEADMNLIQGSIASPAAPNENLQAAMGRFKEGYGVQTTGYLQTSGTVLGGLQTSGVSQGWSDYKMEDFQDTLPQFIASPAYEIPQPQYRTLELRPSDLPSATFSPVDPKIFYPNRIVSPQNPDPSYDQPALDSRWYTIPKNRIENPGFTVTKRYVDEGMKPSNPKDAIGSGKLPLHLWPATATAMGCIGFLNGMLKYGRANFRAIGIRSSIYVDAAKRHIDAWFEGEECDPDDGVPHLAAALACLGIIVDAQAAGKLNDDRQVRGGYRALVASLTPHVARLKALHATKDPKHYTIADNATLV